METLAEDLLLLALDDDAGAVSWRHATALPYGLGGALLLDLVLLGRVAGADHAIVLADPAPTGDAMLDEALAAISGADRPRDARRWVKRLGRRPDLQDQLARRLVARGIVRERERTFLRVFHASRFPTDDPGPEAALRARLRAVVLGDAAPDARTLLLLSLLHACGLAGGLFTAEERADARRRVKELVAGERVGQAVGQAIAEVVAATAAVAAAAATVAVVPGAQH